MKTPFLAKALALAGAIFLVSAAAEAATFTRPYASGGNYSSYVKLTWSANSYANYGYYVYRTTTSKFTGAVRLGRVTSRCCIDTSAKMGTAYWYWIAPIRKSGSRLTWMVPKKGVAATEAQKGWRFPGVPQPTATRTTAYVSLKWSSSPAAKKGYRVYRGTSPSYSSASLLASTTGRQYVDRTAYPGRNYYYWILVRGSNCNWYNNSKRVLGYRNLIVPWPNLLWTGQGWDDPLRITWTSTYGARKYMVYRGKTWASAVLIKTMTGTTLYDYGIPHDAEKYYYWVCPVDVEGRRWYNVNKTNWAKRRSE
jgi:hypothetical protein